MGGVLIALRIKGEGEAEMLGFYEAMQNHTIHAYAAGRQTDADCHPQLQRGAQTGEPDAVAGDSAVLTGLSGGGTWRKRRSDARTDGDHFRTDGGLRHAARRSGPGETGWARAGVYSCRFRLCPLLEKQLAMRWRLGVRNSAHTLAKLAMPFAEDAALRLSSVSHRSTFRASRNFLPTSAGARLLMHGTEGGVYANPQRCPQSA